MKTPADRARENSIALEVKKDGLQQRQGGDWMLRFTVAATDMHQVIVNAAMGTRFQCVLVEIDDGEMPVEHKAEERDKWRALGPAKQAGIRCKDPVFQAFLKEEYRYAVVRDLTTEVDSEEERAAIAVRWICNVLTRSDLGKPGFSDQRVLWFELDNKFQAWRALERA